MGSEILKSPGGSSTKESLGVVTEPITLSNPGSVYDKSVTLFFPKFFCDLNSKVKRVRHLLSKYRTILKTSSDF